MKNVLLLTDFSENSKNAMHYALAFFKEDKCQFFVMNVQKMGSFTTDDLILSSQENIYGSIIKKPKQQLNTIVEKLQESYQNPKHKFEQIIDFDDFTDAINQVVKSKNIDLVVLGSNGKTGAKEIIFGSNTIHVMRNVNCTTLIIPESYTYKPVKTVLLPLEINDYLHENKVSELKEFIETYKLNLSVLRLNSDHTNSEYAFYDQSNLSQLEYKYFTINNVPLHYAMNSFIQIFPIDMALIFVKKLNLLDHWMHRSSKTRISNSLQIPLLIYHEN